ncbi:MAG: hypothetical protein AAF403_02460, partial [Pseudomonadota bacterium]
QISSSFVDTDGSETLVVYIGGAPTGVSLSAGTLSNQIWTLQQTQLSGLKLTSAPHSDHEFTISLTSLTSEDDGTHSIFTTSFLSVKVSGVADTAKLQITKTSRFEEQIISLQISTSRIDTDGSETLVIYISGAPTGISLSAGILSNHIWTLQQAQLSGLKITPTPHQGQDFTLLVTSLTSEDDGTHSIFTTSNLAVKVSAIADTARLQTVKASGFEDKAITLQISRSLVDTDGSETLVVYIGGVPTGVSLSAGTLSNQIWTLQQTQLSGLKLTSFPHSDHDFTISLTSLTSEDDGTHSIFITSAISVNARAVVDPITIGAGGMSILEDQVITLALSIALIDTDGSETLVIYMTNLPTGVSLSAGALSNNVWTLYEDQISGLKLTPITHSDEDFTFKVTALVSELNDAQSAFSTGSIGVQLKAVADSGNFSLPPIATLLEGGGNTTPIALSSVIADTDGSETAIIYIRSPRLGLELFTPVTELLQTPAFTASNNGGWGVTTPPSTHAFADATTFNVPASQYNGYLHQLGTINSGPSRLSRSVTGLIPGQQYTLEVSLARSRDANGNLIPATVANFSDISIMSVFGGAFTSTGLTYSDLPRDGSFRTFEVNFTATQTTSTLQIANNPTGGSRTIPILISQASLYQRQYIPRSNTFWTLHHSQLSNLHVQTRLNPSSSSDQDYTLSVTTVTSEDHSTVTTVSSGSLVVEIKPVANAPELTFSHPINSNLDEDDTVSVVISVGLVDTDGSESLIIYVNHLPTGVSLTAGTLSSNVWTLTQQQLRGLKLTSDDRYGRFTMQVAATSYEKDDPTITATTKANVFITVYESLSTPTIQNLPTTLGVNPIGFVLGESLPGSTLLLSDHFMTPATTTWYHSGTLTPANRLTASTLTNRGFTSTELAIDLSPATAQPSGGAFRRQINFFLPTIPSSFTTQRTYPANSIDAYFEVDLAHAVNSGGAVLSAGGSRIEFVYGSQTFSVDTSELPADGSRKKFRFSFSLDRGVGNVRFDINNIVSSTSIASPVISHFSIGERPLQTKALIADTDGSETVRMIISGVPAGISLSSGTLSNGKWTVPNAQFSNLVFQQNTYTGGNFTLQVTAVTQPENPMAGSATLMTTSQVAIDYGVGRLTLDQQNNDATILDGDVFTLSISVGLTNDDGDASDTVVIYISNFPSGASLSAGTL